MIRPGALGWKGTWNPKVYRGGRADANFRLPAPVSKSAAAPMIARSEVATILPLRKSPPRMLGETLVRYRGWLLVLGVIVVAAATPLSRQLTLDRQITSMFAEDDDVLRQYQRLQAEFGGNVVVMLVYRDDALLTTAGIDRNRRLTERVAGLPGVRGVLSPAKLNDVIAKIRPASLFGFGGTPEGPQLADPDDPVALGFLDLFAGYTHSSDLASAAVVA